MYKLKNPLYHNNTIVRTEDFTQLADFSLDNLVNILSSFSGNQTMKQLEFLLGKKFLGEKKGEDQNNAIFNTQGYYPFIVDGFFPICDDYWIQEDHRIERLMERLRGETLLISPGVAIVTIKGKPLLVASPEASLISRVTEGKKEGIVYGKIVPIEKEKRNLLVRSSSSGQSYVDSLFTEIEYTVEFYPVFNNFGYENQDDEKKFKKGLFLPDDNSFPFMRFDENQFFLDGHFFPSNLYSLQREFWNASPEWNKTISTKSIVESIFKGKSFSSYEGNLARWDERGRLQCKMKSDYPAFEGDDLINASYAKILDLRLERKIEEEIASIRAYDMFPSGTILMYNGYDWENNVTMKGWYMCDGENGTPDLRDRFIRCSITANQVGANAGEGKIELYECNIPLHSHTVNGHGHDVRCDYSGEVDKNFTTYSAGKHAHDISWGGVHSHEFGTRYSDSASGKHYPKRAVNGSNLDLSTKEGGYHTHSMNDKGEHSHGIRIRIPAHSHSISILDVPETQTGQAGGRVPIFFHDKIKGYDLIFIMKK